MPLEDIDSDTIQYFGDLFEKEGISIEDDKAASLQAHCSGNTPGIPVPCFNSIYPAFCQDVETDESKNLSKSFTGLDSIIGGQISHLLASKQRGVRRRRLTKKRICGDWTFQIDWSGAHDKCDKSCSDYLSIPWYTVPPRQDQ